MHVYTLGQWLILFFSYCIAGWIFESCFVSAKQHKWVNRGFLNGPWLPIYGSGAIIVLFATLPVQNNLFLVWLLGMISATILEYVTGAVIEKIFKVRYWDYSSHRFQVKGYICLTSSVAWGFFAILLIKFIHPPFAKFLSDIPSMLIDPVSMVLVVLFTIDTVHSVREALDLRNVLTKLTEENEDLRKLAKRAEVISTFAEDDLKKFRNKTELNRILIETYVKEEIDTQIEKYNALKINKKEKIQQRIENAINIKLDILENIAAEFEKKQNQHDDYDKAMEMIQSYRYSLKGRKVDTYKHAYRILHANPSAHAELFKEAMDMLRKLDK